MEYPATATAPARMAKRQTTVSVSACLFLMGLVMSFAAKSLRDTRRGTAVETTGEFIAGSVPHREIMAEGVGR